jgi:ComF family protein
MDFSAKVIRGVLSDLAVLVYPPECAFCSAAVPQDQRLCGRCTQQLVSSAHRCQRCAMPLPEVLPNDDCIHCRKIDWRFSRVIALGSYRGRLKEAVILCKKLRCESLRFALALQMVEQVRARIPETEHQAPLLIPIPNHWTRAFSRAAPTANRLADLMSRSTGWPVATGMVVKVRKTLKQGMLSASERRKNVRGAFLKKSAESLRGRHVVIVDDVLTSGATANEVARQLWRCHPKDVSVTVIARGAGR